MVVAFTGRKKNTGQEAGVEEEMKNWLDLSPEVLERGQG